MIAVRTTLPLRLSARLPAALLVLSLAACNEPAPVVAWDPAQVERQLPEVVAALRAHAPQRALNLLDALAGAQALPDGADHLRALALQDLHRTAEAESAWEAELKQHPGNGRAHAQLAELLLDGGRSDEAQAHLESARAFAPDFALIPLVAGRLALQQGDDDRAQRAYRDFLMADPHGPAAAEAHHALALILARRGPSGLADADAHERASQALMQAYGSLDECEARLSINPNDLEAAGGVAHAYLNLYQTFAGDRRLLAKIEPALLYILERKPDDAMALYNLGYVRAEQKRLPEAIELFRKSIAADPGSAAVRINLGRALLVLGRNDEARLELERALQVATTDDERGRALLELGHEAEAGSRPETWAVAIQHYDAVRRLDPSDPMELGAQIEKLKRAIAEAEAHDRSPETPRR